MATEIIIKEKVFGATRQLLRISVGVCQEKKPTRKYHIRFLGQQQLLYTTQQRT